MSEPKVVWEEPPPALNKYERIVTSLRERPDVWARVSESPSGSTARSFARAVRKASNQHVEVVVRKIGPRYRVWARWLTRGGPVDE